MADISNLYVFTPVYTTTQQGASEVSAGVVLVFSTTGSTPKPPPGFNPGFN